MVEAMRNVCKRPAAVCELPKFYGMTECRLAGNQTYALQGKQPCVVPRVGTSTASPVQLSNSQHTLGLCHLVSRNIFPILKSQCSVVVISFLFPLCQRHFKTKRIGLFLVVNSPSFVN